MKRNYAYTVMKMTETDKCRYANSKIYKLIYNEGYRYWVSTSMALHERYFSYKQKSKKEPERKVYTVFTYNRFLSVISRILFTI